MPYINILPPGTLILPTHVVESIQRKRLEEIKQMVKEEKLANDPGYQYEQERAKKDTKPITVMDSSDRNRPVIVVGGGEYYEDLKDKAKRLKEKPDPKLDPDRKWKADPKRDVGEALDRYYRGKRGTAVFHFPNNPLTKKDG